LKKYNFIIASAFAIMLFMPIVIFSQNENNGLTINSNDINRVLYGSSDELISGKTYLPEHPLAKGNPFYDDRSKISGTIYIKGNKYPGNVFGYDIVNERVILNVFQKNSAQFEIELNEALIDSMMIGNTFFVNSALKIIPGFESGFIEIIYKGDLLFVERHRKTFVNQYSTSSPHGFYTPDKSEYYLIADTIPIRISSKKSFLNEFEPNKKEIKKYMKSIRFKFKKANTEQWMKLLKYCDNLSSS